MNTTSTAPSAAVLVEPETGPSTLLITLLTDEIVELAVRGWNIDTLIEGTFRRGYFRATDGRFYPAHQIRFIVEGGSEK